MEFENVHFSNDTPFFIIRLVIACRKDSCLVKLNNIPDGHTKRSGKF